MENLSSWKYNEMEMFRFKLKPRGSFQTRWSSDTLSGALFWAYCRREGEDALAALLQEYCLCTPPFVLSSGFPGDLLPKPLLPPRQKKGETSLEALRLNKKIKKAEWVLLDDFNRCLAGEEIIYRELQPPFLAELVMHNAVSRITGTTGDSHSLFAAEELFLNKGYEYISVYAFVRKDWQKTLQAMFEDLGKGGIGGRSSTGKGTFDVAACDRFSFPVVRDANGYILLGSAVPGDPDPSRGYFKIEIKRGRLGEERANEGNPFKKPIIMLKPGSVFYHGSKIKWMGRLINGIAPGFPRAVQCGMAIVVPALLPETKARGEA